MMKQSKAVRPCHTTANDSQPTLGALLVKYKKEFSEEQLQDMNGMTALQVVGYVTYILSVRYPSRVPAQWRNIKLQRLINEILAIPEEAKRMRQLREFSESFVKKFPDSWSCAGIAGDAIADFLSSELLPNVAPKMRREVIASIERVRSGEYSVYTASTLFNKVPFYTPLWPEQTGSFMKDYRTFEQRIIGLSVLRINFRSRRRAHIANDAIACINLMTDWRVGSSESRKIVRVTPNVVTPQVRTMIQDLLSSLQCPISLPGDIMTLHPRHIADHLRSEAGALRHNASQCSKSGFLRDRIEASEDWDSAAKLCEAADRIDAMGRKS